MRTFEAIALAVVSSAVTLAIFAQSGPARAQQPTPAPTQPRPFADRATEGVGATIFGNVCGACHGKESVNDAMWPLVSVELPAGSREARHVHSGTLVAYVKEGALTLDYEGKPTVTYKVGETFSVEPGKVHEGMNKGNVTTRLIATLFPKDQPMTTQVKQ